MSFVWTNSTKSGLGDRLIDLFIIASYATLLNKVLYMTWEEEPISELQKIIWNPIRFNDYKIENLIQYFSFPDCIHIVSKDKLNEIMNQQHLEKMIFHSYLGGVYSPVTFYDCFIDKHYSLDEYLKHFNTNINQFKPTRKLLNIVEQLPNNIISIHLRRTDKCSSFISPSITHGVSLEELSILDSKTNSIINQYINQGYKNLFFCSDSTESKLEYQTKYKNQYIVNFNQNTIEQTYIDLYIMSVSEIIILSQRHSSFSLFACFVNSAKLIYFYNDDIITNSRYNYFKNIEYIK